MLPLIPMLIYLIIINIIGAVLVVYDKSISKLPRGSIRRIPEKRFVKISALGGGFGTLLAMMTVRHKTKEHGGLLLKIAGYALLWVVVIVIFAVF